MSRVRPGWFGVAAFLLYLLNVSTSAQQPVAPDDYILSLFNRTAAKHRRARRNLETILRDQPQFFQELQGVARRLETQPAWLLNVMAAESQFILNARNPLPGQTASGLLQIIEATARRLGTTTKAIRGMDAMDQLRLVERYLLPFKGRLNSLTDVYMAVFRGSIIEGGDGVVVLDASKKPRVYALNKSLDLNRDRYITKGELGFAALSVGRFVPERSARRLGAGNRSLATNSLRARPNTFQASRTITNRRGRSQSPTRSIYVRAVRQKTQSNR